MEWILPASLSTYKINEAFREIKTVEWHQGKNIKNVDAGDIVYIYLSTPEQRIQWKCRVIETNRMETEIDDTKYYTDPTPNFNQSDGPFLVLTAIKEYDVGPLLDYDRLKKYGLKSRLMGPQRVQGELAKYIAAMDDVALVQEFQKADASDMPSLQLEVIAKKHSTAVVKETTQTVKQYVRDAYVAQYAKYRANGTCQLCGKKAPFTDKSGKPYLESHHIVWLSDGGADSVDNTVALCPNCHRKMHIVNDEKDIKSLKKKEY